VNLLIGYVIGHTIFGFIWISNIGQVVHKTPNPTFFERLGRK
jgi:hypothetical protein